MSDSYDSKPQNGKKYWPTDMTLNHKMGGTKEEP